MKPMFACCAFAVFLLHQLLLPLIKLQRWLGWTVTRSSGAAAWRPGASVPPAKPRRLPVLGAGLVALLAFEAMAGSIAAVSALLVTRSVPQAQAVLAAADPICTAFVGVSP
ncbi:hypothetical protein [Bradyrhizobium sp. CCBAU 53338]|uniref:hypothetical protein n=1 Tax=Bradyrhizobium sp. CCBAU 53338 TaxID=1325111 RepID=UPI00188C46E9|nr:hypothetical protein [Bradyrhizobium sp. CCBAU 53338]